MKKLLLSIFLALFLFSSSLGLLASSAKAADWGPVWYDTNLLNFPSWYLKVYDDESTPPTEIFGERYTAAQVQWIVYSLFSGTLNALPGRGFGVCVFKRLSGDVSAIWTCVDALIDTINSVTENTNNQNFSLTKFFASQPVSAIGYIINKVNNFHLVPQTYAQGFGYVTAGNMVQQVWKAARDIAYSLLVLVVIIFAFMIMFRVKLNPQTVVTVQSSLPKIIIAIILVTFSYAIAGFLIDIMYLIIGLLSLLLSVGGQITNLGSVALFTEFINSNILTKCQYFVAAFLASSAIAIFKNLAAGAVGVVLSFILIFHVAFSLFKIIIMVFKAYANIVIGIITGPLEILFGTVTGGGFGGWAKRMLSSLIIFPVICLMFFFCFFFLKQSNNVPPNAFTYGVQTVAESKNPWIPPFLPKASDGVLLWIMVSYVVFVSIPKAGEIASGIISGKMPQMESAIGEATAAGFARARGIATAPAGWGASGLEAYGKAAEATATTSSGKFLASITTGIPASILRKIKGR